MIKHLQPIYKLIHKILTKKTLTWQKTQTEDPFGGYEAGNLTKQHGYEAGDLTKQHHAQCQLDEEAAAPSRGRRWWWTNLQWWQWCCCSRPHQEDDLLVKGPVTPKNTLVSNELVVERNEPKDI